jgi:hypothetical protein
MSKIIREMSTCCGCTRGCEVLPVSYVEIGHNQCSCFKRGRRGRRGHKGLVGSPGPTGTTGPTGSTASAFPPNASIRIDNGNAGAIVQGPTGIVPFDFAFSTFKPATFAPGLNGISILQTGNYVVTWIIPCVRMGGNAVGGMVGGNADMPMATAGRGGLWSYSLAFSITSAPFLVQASVVADSVQLSTVTASGGLGVMNIMQSSDGP